MSQPPSPPLPASPVQTGPVVFRMLTPVFKFEIEGANHFTHSGQIGSASFEIELRPYAVNLPDFAHFTRYATEGIRDTLRQRAIHLSDHFTAHAGHFLVVDVSHPAASDVARNTPECLTVQQATVNALRLHSSAGLPHHETYEFRSPPARWEGLGIHTPNTRQVRFSHLACPSTLRSADFPSLRKTLDRLTTKQWRETTLDKVLRLAMEYHRLVFTVERAEHAFLILMVGYEAMFKRDATENASKPAQRIGRLLGAVTKSDCQAIQREFSDAPDSFSKIRNQIAHGDPNLAFATVTIKYPLLYRHLTAAIVNLLNLAPGTVDETKGYYDEISRITEERFRMLPGK